MSHEEVVITAVRQWVEQFVVGLNLCPFAKPELQKGNVRFSVSGALTEQDLLIDLENELQRLQQDQSVETTLLIHPRVLESFIHYNDFLDLAEGLVSQMQLDGVFQIASFHPDYQFSGTDADDAENFTNRSPYPMLHILREASLDRVLATTAHAEKIPERNIATMNRLGADELIKMLSAYD